MASLIPTMLPQVQQGNNSVAIEAYMNALGKNNVLNDINRLIGTAVRAKEQEEANKASAYALQEIENGRSVGAILKDLKANGFSENTLAAAGIQKKLEEARDSIIKQRIEDRATADRALEEQAGLLMGRIQREYASTGAVGVRDLINNDKDISNALLKNYKLSGSLSDFINRAGIDTTPVNFQENEITAPTPISADDFAIARNRGNELYRKGSRQGLGGSYDETTPLSEKNRSAYISEFIKNNKLDDQEAVKFVERYNEADRLIDSITSEMPGRPALPDSDKINIISKALDRTWASRIPGFSNSYTFDESYLRQLTREHATNYDQKANIYKNVMQYRKILDEATSNGTLASYNTLMANLAKKAKDLKAAGRSESFIRQYLDQQLKAANSTVQKLGEAVQYLNSPEAQQLSSLLSATLNN